MPSTEGAKLLKTSLTRPDVPRNAVSVHKPLSAILTNALKYPPRVRYSWLVEQYCSFLEEYPNLDTHKKG